MPSYISLRAHARTAGCISTLPVYVCNRKLYRVVLSASSLSNKFLTF